MYTAFQQFLYTCIVKIEEGLKGSKWEVCFLKTAKDINTNKDGNRPSQ